MCGFCGVFLLPVAAVQLAFLKPEGFQFESRLICEHPEAKDRLLSISVLCSAGIHCSNVWKKQDVDTDPLLDHH